MAEQETVTPQTTNSVIEGVKNEGPAFIPDPDMEKAEYVADQSAKNAFRNDAMKAATEAPDVDESTVVDFLQDLPGEALDVLATGARKAPGELISLGPGVLRGAVSGVENAFNTMVELENSVRPYISGEVGGLEVDPIGWSAGIREFVTSNLGIGLEDDEGTGKADLPKPREQEKMTGQAAEAITQFLVGFIPAFKAARGVNAMQKLGMAKEIVSAMAAGSFAGFFTTDEQQDNALRTLLDTFPDLEGPVLEFLATDDDDPVLANKARHAVEEAILGPLGDAVFKGLVWTRQAWKNAGKKELQVAAEGALQIDASDIPVKFGGELDVQAPIVQMTPKMEQASSKFLEEQLVPKTGPITEFAQEELDDAARFYAGTGYRTLNDALRKAMQNLPDDLDNALAMWGVQNVEAFKTRVSQLDFLTTQHATKPGGLLWRGTIVNYNRYKSWKPGDEITLAGGGFTSSSKSEMQALSFATERFPKEGEMPVLFEIETVEGGTVFDMDKTGLGLHGEREVLFPRHSIFEVVEIDTSSTVPMVKVRHKPGKEATDPITTADPMTPPEQVLNINLRKMNTRDDIKFAIQKVDELMSGEFRELRGPVDLPNVEITKLADSTGVPVSQIEKTWGSDNASRIFAARKLLVASASNLIRLSEIAKASRDPADLVAFRKAFAVHSAIQAEVVGRAAEAGRSLRAFQIPVDSDENLARNLNRLLDQSGGPNMAQSMAELTSQLSPEQINRAGALPDTRTMAGKAFDVFTEWWINALLSAPTTHIVNTLSNSATALWSIPENALAQAATRGWQAGSITAAARIYGLLTGIKDGSRLVAHVLKHGEMPEDTASKIDINRIPETITASGDNLPASAIRLLGQVIRLPGKTLMLEDMFFKSVGYSMKRSEMAALRAYDSGATGKDWANQFLASIADPTDDIRLASISEAEYLTFTNPTGDIAAALTKARNAVPLLKLFFPFVNTPANILQYTFERTPLAPLASRYRNAIKAGGADAARARAKMFLGTMQMMAFADYAAQGLITGSGPVDPDLRRVWLEDHQPYSIKVGDNWVQYSRLDPLGFLIGFSADFAQIAGYLDENESGEVVAAAIMATTANFTDKTYLAGLSMLNEFLASGHATPELDMHTLERTLGQFGSSALVPRGVFAVRQSMDPTLRAVEDFKARLMSQIPGYSDELPAEHNVWGEPVIPSPGMGQGNMGALYRGISPFRAKPVTDDPVNKMLLDNNIGVSYPNRTMSGVELTEAEYQYLKVARGKRARQAIEQMMQTVDFQDAPRHIKESMVKRVFTQASKAARAELFQAFPDLVTRLQYKRKFDLETDPTEAERQ